MQSMHGLHSYRCPVADRFPGSGLSSRTAQRPQNRRRLRAAADADQDVSQKGTGKSPASSRASQSSQGQKPQGSSNANGNRLTAFAKQSGSTGPDTTQQPTSASRQPQKAVTPPSPAFSTKSAAASQQEAVPPSDSKQAGSQHSSSAVKQPPEKNVNRPSPAFSGKSAAASQTDALPPNSTKQAETQRLPAAVSTARSSNGSSQNGGPSSKSKASSAAAQTNGSSQSISSSSKDKAAGHKKPPEAKTDMPTPASDESIVMPSTAAAQAASHTSVADAEAAVRADRRQAFMHGAEPSFIIPQVPGFPPNRQVSHLPLMIYIPGIDGTGMAASRQFPGLMANFDFRAFSVPLNNRTSFTGLVEIVKAYLEAEVDVNQPERPVYLLGESFGAVLALAVAHDKTDLVDRLVLVNPATSYEKSIWPRLGPALANLPEAAYGAIPYALSPVLGNPLALAAVSVDRKADPFTQAAQYADGLRKLIPQLGNLAKILPPEVLQWKLELLKQGNSVVKSQLAYIQQRVFLLTADGDLLIPSKEEGSRLKSLLPRCRHQVFKNASHALLQEADVNLAQLMKQQGFYVTKRDMSAPVKKRTKSSFGSAAPIEKPTLEELDYYSEGAFSVKNLKSLQSPIWLSTGRDGRVQHGCGGIPLDRPLLLVSNHQTFAVDIGILIDGLLRQTGLLPRGLTHPAVFQGNLEQRQDNPDPRRNVFGSLLTTFGSVEVGGRNFFKLMQQGECVLLYPGGVREAYKRRGEEYKLFWPKQPEFVRMAARFGATIVPFAGVGLDDGFEMLLDPQEIRNIPFLGKALEDNAKKQIPPARRGIAQKEDMEELFIQPLPLPKLPQRLYFKFQQGIQTNPADAKDPVRVQQIYDETKRSCEEAISYLRTNRERDPYKDFFKRTFYERSWGGKQAPTFPLD